MAKTKISEFSATPASNTDIDSIFIGEGMAPSNVNDAIRELMAQLKDWQSGTSNDPMVIGSSGTLGVGGAASVPLDVYANSSALNLRLRGRSADSIGQVEFYNNAGSTRYGYLSSESTAITLATVGAIPLNFVTNGAERARIDSSGNLGLGVTPSAFNLAGYKFIEVGTAGNLLLGGSYNFASTSNAYYNSGWKYAITGAGATQYEQINGSHNWKIAGNGTAGNAITFTQAMTLAANGNLGIANTSPSGILSIGNTSTVNPSVRIVSSSTAGSDTQQFALTLDGAADFAGMKISHTDRVAKGLQLFTASGYGFPISFSTNGSQNVTIDSSGNLLVGTTSVSLGALGNFVKSNATNYMMYVENSANNSGDKTFRSVLGSNCNGTSAFHFVANTGGNDRLYIYGNGNVVNSNNSYGGLSDVKLKENIVDATPKLAGLMQVKVRNYNMIGDTTKQIGVVAQELETVFPSMVDETIDTDAEGNDLDTTTKSVKYSVFVPMLIKAIQELKTEFDAYKASHP